MQLVSFLKALFIQEVLLQVFYKQELCGLLKLLVQLLVTLWLSLCHQWMNGSEKRVIVYIKELGEFIKSKEKQR